MTSTFDRDLAPALAAMARKAGRVILDVYETDFTVTIKANQTPVTEADARAEEVILADLHRIAPSIPVISEEAGGPVPPGPAPERFFLVDPLDGTREFIERNGEFTVNIALIEAGRPVAGVVLAPAIKRMFLACGEGHAFELPARAETSDVPGRDAWRAIATRASRPDALRAVASRSHRNAQTDAFLARIGAHSIVIAGSSLKFCLLACGEADVYPRHGRTMEWDTAAGQAVLEAAGGVVLTLGGEALRYGKGEEGYVNPPFIAWRHRDIATV